MKSQETTPPQEGQLPPIKSLQSFIAELGISPITAWRFRKRGWLETVNISGRQYVTAAGIARFTARAESGEFAKDHKAPRREVAA